MKNCVVRMSIPISNFLSVMKKRKSPHHKPFSTYVHDDNNQVIYTLRHSLIVRSSEEHVRWKYKQIYSIVLQKNACWWKISLRTNFATFHSFLAHNSLNIIKISLLSDFIPFQFTLEMHFTIPFAFFSILASHVARKTEFLLHFSNISCIHCIKTLELQNLVQSKYFQVHIQ